MILPRTIVIGERKTSVSMEEAFWQALKRLAKDKGYTINALVTRIDVWRSEQPVQYTLASSIRIFVINDLQKRLASP